MTSFFSCIACWHRAAYNEIRNLREDKVLQSEQMLVTSWLAVGSYLIAWLIQLLDSQRQSFNFSRLNVVMVLIGLMSHASCLFFLIDTPEGGNFSLTNVFSAACWILLCFLTLWRRIILLRPIQYLLLPTSAVSKFVAVQVLDRRLVDTKGHIMMSLHIIVGLFVLALAGLVFLQALLTLVQYRQLRDKKVFGWLERMPPLEITERLLLQCVRGLFFLLTLVMLLSFILFEGNLGHASFSWWLGGGAWLVLGVVWIAFQKGRLSAVQVSAWVILAVVALLNG